MPRDALPSEATLATANFNNPTGELPTPLITGVAAKLVQITKLLTDVIRRETGLLEKRKPKEAQLLHGEKSRLMAEYRETLNHLQVNSHLLGAQDSEPRKYIRKITDKLRDALKDHARIVLRLKSVTEGIIKSVGEEVAKQKRPVVGYGKNAVIQPPRGMQPTSLSLNRVI